MQKKEKTIILILGLAIMCGCVQKDAVRITPELEVLTAKVDHISDMANNLAVWQKKIEAQTIIYNGSGWVVVGTSIIALIFVGAGLLLVRSFMKRGTLLSMTTKAIKEASRKDSSIGDLIKEQIAEQIKNREATETDRAELGIFTKRIGSNLSEK